MACPAPGYPSLSVPDAMHVFTQYAVARGVLKARCAPLLLRVVQSGVFPNIEAFDARRHEVYAALLAGLPKADYDRVKNRDGSVRRKQILSNLRVMLHRLRKVFLRACSLKASTDHSTADMSSTCSASAQLGGSLSDVLVVASSSDPPSDHCADAVQGVRVPCYSRIYLFLTVAFYPACCRSSRWFCG